MKKTDKNTLNIDQLKEACYRACLAKLAEGIREIQREKTKIKQGS